MLGNNIIRQILTQVLGLISALVISIITARILGPERRGDFALLLNTSGFLSFLFGFGFGTSIIHILSTNKMPARAVVNSFGLFIFGSILLCLIVLVVYPFCKGLPFLPNNGNTLFYLGLLLLFFILSMLLTLYNSVLTGSRLFRQQQVTTMVIAIISVLAYCSLAYYKNKNGLEFNNFLWFYLAIMTLPVIGAFFMYTKYAQPVFSNDWLNKDQIKYVLTFSFLAYLGSVFHFLTCKLDFWLVEYYQGSKNLGYYSLASNLAQMLWIIPQAIASILIAYSGSDDQQKNIENTNILARVSLFVVFIAAIFSALLGGIFIPLLFGNEFSDSVYLFRFLLIGIVPFCLTTILASYFAGVGKIKVNLYCSILSFAVCLIADLIFIPLFGNSGAVISGILAYFSGTAFIIFVYKRHTGIKPNQIIFITRNDIKLVKNKIGGSRAT